MKGVPLNDDVDRDLLYDLAPLMFLDKEIVNWYREKLDPERYHATHKYNPFRCLIDGRRNVYKRNRLLCIQRDNYKCIWCGVSEKLTVDHIIQRSKGGTHELDNLRTLCQSCHTQRHYGN